MAIYYNVWLQQYGYLLEADLLAQEQAGGLGAKCKLPTHLVKQHFKSPGRHKFDCVNLLFEWNFPIEDWLRNMSV